MIDTRTVRRRPVSYASLADFARDLDCIEASFRAGALSKLGNHEPGAILLHLGIAMRYSFNGFPSAAPLPLRVLGRLLKRRILSKPFKPGLRLRPDAEKHAWTEDVSFDESLDLLRGEISRAAALDAAPNCPHPFFGPMTPGEWQNYHLRHAELHMSFLDP